MGVLFKVACPVPRESMAARIQMALNGMGLLGFQSGKSRGWTATAKHTEAEVCVLPSSEALRNGYPIILFLVRSSNIIAFVDRYCKQCFRFTDLVLRYNLKIYLY